MNDKIVHILRYGTVGEKKHLAKTKSTYDFLSINGNSAAFVSTAIAKMILDEFILDVKKGFFIDPITYAFQRDINLLKAKPPKGKNGTDKLKKSIIQLINYYGYPATNVIDNIPIQKTDFQGSNQNEFCRRVLSFQYNLVSNHINENDLKKYIDYVIKDDPNISKCLKPKFLIAPYFFLTQNDNDFMKWLDLNIQFIKDAVRLSHTEFDNCQIFGQLVIGKEILNDPGIIDYIANRYSQAACDGLTIWVDDFSEHTATEDELAGFIRLLGKLKSKPVYNMYGGYFSILLTHRDVGLLKGVSHGLEYGESRKVYPVGGGVPVSKYYFFPIHQRLDFNDAYNLLAATNVIDIKKEDWGSPVAYFDEICKCKQCHNIIKDSMIDFIKFESKGFYEVQRKDVTIRRKKATPDTKENCLYHFLLCKKCEFARVAKYNISTLLNELLITKSKYDECILENPLDLSYLERWNRQIGGVVNGHE